MKKVMVDLRMFQHLVYFIIGPGKVPAKLLPKGYDYDFTGEEYSGLCTVGTSTYEGYDYYTIVIHINHPTLATVTHEAVHAINRILSHIGSVPKHEDDEVQAYLVDYLVQSCEEVWPDCVNLFPTAGV